MRNLLAKPRMPDKTQCMDVSVRVSPRVSMWPGSPPFEIKQHKIPLGNKNVVTVSHMKLIPHCGTHIDAPLHFDKNGDAIDVADLTLLIGPCRVLEHKPRRHITRSDLDVLGSERPLRLLIKTRNSQQLRAGKLDKNFISLLPDAVDEVIRRGVRVLGVDGFSIGPYGAISDRNHVKYCPTGGLIIEVLDLSDVEPGEYFLVALPVKIQGAEAAPARVLLFRPNDVPSELSRTHRDTPIHSPKQTQPRNARNRARD